MRINIKTLRYSKWLAVTLIIRYNSYKTFLFLEFFISCNNPKKSNIWTIHRIPCRANKLYSYIVKGNWLFDFDVGELSPVRTSDIHGLHSVGHRFIYISYIRRELGCFKKPGVYNEGKEEPDHLYRNFLFKLLVDWSFVATNWTMGKRLCVCLFIESPETFRPHSFRVTSFSLY